MTSPEASEDAVDVGPDEDEPSLLRASALISALNLVSRVTGFVRVLAIGGALGATFLGNTYHSANLVSNVLFELLAAGLLSSVLVPAFVPSLQRSRTQAEQLAGAVLGALLAVLAVVVLVGFVTRPWIMRALTAGVSDDSIRDDEVRLGAFLLWFFLPQLLLYAVGAVATGLLQADHRFLAAAAAPAVNNVVVVATMGVFWAMRNASDPTLDVSSGEKLVLAVGTTTGVLAMAAVPWLAAWRAGLHVVPRWAPRDRELRDLARQGAWAATQLGLFQVLVAVTLVFANRVEGGVVAYQIAFTFFLLPHALIAHPVYTALYPRLASAGSLHDWAGFARRLAEGLRANTFLLVLATSVLVAVARPVLDVVAIGALAGTGPGRVAPVLVAYALGLLGYSVLHLLTRAAYAAGDSRTPTVVTLVAIGVGIVAMAWGSASAEGNDRVVALGAAHSVAMIGAAGALLVLLQRRVGRSFAIGRGLARAVLAGGAAAVAGRLVVAAFDEGSRLTAGGAGVAGVLVCASVYIAVQAVLRAPELSALTRRHQMATPK